MCVLFIWLLFIWLFYLCLRLVTTVFRFIFLFFSVGVYLLHRFFCRAVHWLRHAGLGSQESSSVDAYHISPLHVVGRWAQVFLWHDATTFVQALRCQDWGSSSKSYLSVDCEHPSLLREIRLEHEAHWNISRAHGFASAIWSAIVSLSPNFDWTSAAHSAAHWNDD